MKMGCITGDEARAKLRKLCDEEGGVGELARKLGLTISAVSHQLSGRRPIQGKVAKHMGLRIEKETKVYYREAD
ncbi:transcriptional repressor [Desulfofustis phage LS06-2018-MD02]|jgi:DNA-binding transcriptional ArsR family regulator|nr:transcriptional repressor [Desulfofustis phage LS06-2018-MD02]